MNAVKIAKSQNKCIFHVRLRKLSHKFLILQSRNYIAKQKQNIILLQTKKMAKMKKTGSGPGSGTFRALTSAHGNVNGSHHFGNERGIPWVGWYSVTKLFVHWLTQGSCKIPDIFSSPMFQSYHFLFYFYLVYPQRLYTDFNKTVFRKNNSAKKICIPKPIY